jgi:membrane protein YdbS with pleckstrin-like domain
MNSDEEFLEIRSSLINALLPPFMKHVFYNSSFVFLLYLIYWLFDLLFDFPYDFLVILSLVFLTLSISFILILKNVIRIRAKSYKFYAHYMEEHYKLFHEENHTINYKQITDIEVKKNVWDRMCGVGDLIIHTSNDESIDSEKALIIKDIRKPELLKKQIIERIHL